MPIRLTSLSTLNRFLPVALAIVLGGCYPRAAHHYPGAPILPLLGSKHDIEARLGSRSGAAIQITENQSLGGYYAGSSEDGVRVDEMGLYGSSLHGGENWKWGLAIDLNHGNSRGLPTGHKREIELFDLRYTAGSAVLIAGFTSTLIDIMPYAGFGLGFGDFSKRLSKPDRDGSEWAEKELTAGFFGYPTFGILGRVGWNNLKVEFSLAMNSSSEDSDIFTEKVSGSFALTYRIQSSVWSKSEPKDKKEKRQNRSRHR